MNHLHVNPCRTGFSQLGINGKERTELFDGAFELPNTAAAKNPELWLQNTRWLLVEGS